MRVFTLSILLIVFMVFTASPALAQDNYALLKVAEGAVDVVRAGQTVKPAVGDNLQTGDVIRTGKDGSAGVMFLDGTRVSLGPSSEMRLDAYRFAPAQKDYAFDVFMTKGSAAYSSGKLGKLGPETVRFSTPHATVGIRGTRFLVKVD